MKEALIYIAAPNMMPQHFISPGSLLGDCRLMLQSCRPDPVDPVDLALGDFSLAFLKSDKIGQKFEQIGEENKFPFDKFR